MEQSEFKVSVIIPVYNAEKYVRKAVEAALSQDEVGEVILIEDCSPDNSLTVCKDLEKEYERVKLYQHPDKKNHGCGASRNYGLSLARYEFIVFSDADNYLLPDRFILDKEIFQNNPSIDGIYHAMGIYYYSSTARDQFKNTVNMELLTFTDIVEPEEVLDVLLGANKKVKGSWGIDSLTIRRKLLFEVGGFNTNLKLQQDVDLFIKIAALGRIASGSIQQPLSMRGVHDQMRSTNIELQNKYRKERWESLVLWAKQSTLLQKIKRRQILKYYRRYRIISETGWTAKRLFLVEILKHPSILLKGDWFFEGNLLRIFGRNWVTLHLVSIKTKILKIRHNNA